MIAIAAVIPAYKAADRIGVAIRSFLDQPAIDPQVIVVIDDGCERTAAIAREFGPRVRVVMNATNLGPGRSRNAGLALATTPYVMFLDSDDWVEDRLLADLADELEGTRGDVALGAFVQYNERTGVRERVIPVAMSTETLFTDWLIGTFYVPPCAVLWRTEAVRGIGGWSDVIRRNDDAELILRAILCGCRVRIAAAGTGVYVWHEAPHRVSRQASRCADLAAAIESLLVIDSSVLSREVVRGAAAEAMYEVARLAFVEDQPLLGRSALRRSRALGFRGHRGSRVARVAGHLVGLEPRIRAARLLQGLHR